MRSTIAFALRGQGTEALELDLYEAIGGDPLFGGGITAKGVLAELNAQPKAKKILVRINSAGGIVTEGLAIYNLLKSNAAEVTCRVDGLAGSIASVIAMAGRLEMPATSYLMIHNPWGWVEGEANDLKHQAAVLESMRETMLDIYCAKSGKGRDFIGAMMDEEKWLTGTEALAYGLCDALIPASNAKLAAHFDLSRFKNTPRSIDTAPRASALTSTVVISDASADEPKLAASVEESLERLLGNTVYLITPPAAETTPDKEAGNPAASGASPMDEEVYKNKIAELEAAVAALKAELDGSKSAQAKAEAELAEAKAKLPKKGEDDDDDEDDEEEMAKASALAEAMELTGCKDVKKLRGALMGYADSLKAKQSSQTVAQRVSELIKAGKVRPDMKAKALKMSHAEIDGYLEMTGGVKLGPVAEEHTPDDEHPNVVQARANAAPPTAKFDPEKVQLTADEIQFCKVMSPLNTDQYKAQFLADKRTREQRKWELAHGVAA